MTEPTHNTLTIATRESPLAMWQAEFVRDRLIERWPDLQVELLGMTTKGDQILDSPLAKVGGKGLFVKELEVALLDGRADIAVHSTKDMPALLPDGLELFICGPRAEPRDALVLPSSDSTLPSRARGSCIDQLPVGAIVGTSSLRRLSQLKHARPDLDCRDLRGNVNTRLAKLDDGHYDAIVLAAAGLQRLGFASRISGLFPVELMLPAVAQGALSIEYRGNDPATQAKFACLQDRSTTLCVLAERALNRHLQGGCQVPIAAFAQLSASHLTLEGRVGSVDGKRLLSASGIAGIDVDGGDLSDQIELADALGVSVAEQLVAAGASELLAEARE